MACEAGRKENCDYPFWEPSCEVLLDAQQAAVLAW